VIPPKTLRQTMLSKASDCPHSAYLYWNLSELGEWPSNDMARGTIWHETAARCIATLAENGEIRMDAADAKAVLHEVLLDRTDVACTAGDVDMLRVMCQHFGDLFVLHGQPRVELPASVDVAGWPVTGTIDLLWVDGDTLYIRDWKAGRGLYRHDEVSGSNAEGERVGSRSAQLNIYTVLAVDGLGLKAEWVDAAFVFPFFVEEDDLGVRRIAERGLRMHISEVIEHRLWLETVVNRVARGFKTDHFPAVAGRHCSMCPDRTACPRPKELRATTVSPYEREPADIAEEAMFMREDAKMRLAELRPYAERYGPIRIGKDRELSFRKPEIGAPRFDFRKAGEGY
jgi:hypothetical protein